MGEMIMIEESFRSAIAAAIDGDRDYFVTLEAASDEKRWAQLSWDMINAAYPLAIDPLRALAEREITLPPLVELCDWRPGEYVTFDHGAEPLADLVVFVERYFERLLDTKPDCENLRVAPGDET
jgi:hypothetical protein